MPEISCPFCHTGLPPQEVAGGWCETCGKKLPSAMLAGTPVPQITKQSEGDNRLRENKGRWLPLQMIAFGMLMLVWNGWPPILPIMFSVGAYIAIAIGIGLWFIERYEVFRPWRQVLHIIFVLVLCATMIAIIAYDINRRAGR
jgi:hypothetical protein